MAKKKATRKRRRSSTPAKKRRTMNGVRTTSYRARSRGRRRMNAVKKSDLMDTVVDVGTVTVGIVGGALLVGVGKKVIENYYGRAGAVAGIGIVTALLAGKYPLVRKLAVGVAAGAAAGAAVKGLQGTKVGALMNGTRRLSDPELKALAERMRNGGRMSRQQETLNGQSDTLNASGMPQVLNGAYQGSDNWNQLFS